MSSATNPFEGIITGVSAGGVSTAEALTKNSDLQEVHVPIAEIFTDEQPHRAMDGEDNTLEELAQSIDERGLLQAVRVTPRGDKYLLVFGHRRLEATKMLGLDSIRATIKEMTDEEVQIERFMENAHRLAPGLMQNASAVKAAMDKHGGDRAEVAKALKKSKGWIAKMLAVVDVQKKVGTELPQSGRLITEGITADAEVVSQVKRLEEKYPEQAEALVDRLADTKGQSSARDVIKQAKDAAKKKAQAGAAHKAGSNGAEAKAKPASTYEVLQECWDRFAAAGFDDAGAIEAMDGTMRTRAERALREDFERGVASTDPAHDLLYRIGTDMYGTREGRRLRFSAFVAGAALQASDAFDMAEILRSARIGR